MHDQQCSELGTLESGCDDVVVVLSVERIWKKLKFRPGAKYVILAVYFPRKIILQKVTTVIKIL